MPEDWRSCFLKSTPGRHPFNPRPDEIGQNAYPTVQVRTLSDP